MRLPVRAKIALLNANESLTREQRIDLFKLKKEHTILKAQEVEMGNEAEQLGNEAEQLGNERIKE